MLFFSKSPHSRQSRCLVSLLTSISAPLSYFTSVDSGVILNRFSQDMAILNGQLPVTFFQAASSMYSLLDH